MGRAMLFVLSPAKTLDFTPAPEDTEATLPDMRADTAKLTAITRKLTAADLKRLMGISDKLAELNVDRFKAFGRRKDEEGVPAALAFAGDVYDGLAARELDADALAWAQDRLRILSGLYGLLRPLDRIQPYRLEMGVRLANPRGSNLYDFWGDRISKALNKAAAGHPDPTVVNLASQEYFGAVDARALKLPVVTCHFKEEKDGLARIVSFYAKIARGMMARYAVDNRIEDARDLRGFDRAGYQFRPQLSGDTDWVFTRSSEAPAPKDMLSPRSASRAWSSADE
jgi:cytoplasmic iron level regulating protein YaaA (DUF328/UPF0246 family)